MPNPIRMMGQVSTAKTAGNYEGVDEDNFNRPDSDTLGAGWEVASWAGSSIRIKGQKARNNIAFGVRWGTANVRKYLSLGSDYSVSIDVYPQPNPWANDGWNYNGGWTLTSKYLFLRMDDTSPHYHTEGVHIQVTFDPDTYHTTLHCSGTIYCMMDGEYYSSDGITGQSYSPVPSKVTITAEVSGNDITVKLDGTTVGTALAPAHSGKRLGLGDVNLNLLSGGCPMDDWRVYGVEVEGDPIPRLTKLTASAGGKFYYEGEPGSFTEVSGASLSIDHSFMCAEMGGKLYIADYGSGYDPKVYNSAANTVATWEADVGKGTLPTQCPLICTYRNRLVLGKDYAWYMSRQNDPDDWDYTQTDVAAAVSSSIVANSDLDKGVLPERLSALAPYANDYLILASPQSLRILRGDPAEGGRIDVISQKTGIMDKFAWCHDPNGAFYFFAHDGLWRMNPDSYPENISNKKLPQELSGVNAEVYEVILEWDTERHGVMIFLTPTSEASAIHYFYDARTEGFFLDSYDSDHGPTAVHDYHADSLVYRRLLLGGRDGYIRAIQKGAADDDGETIDSYVIFSPQRIGGDDLHSGIVESVQAITALGNEEVDYELRVNDDHELAWRTIARVTGTWSADGTQRAITRRIRGGSMALKLGLSSAGRAWGIEKVVAKAIPFGTTRYGPNTASLEGKWEYPMVSSSSSYSSGPSEGVPQSSTSSSQSSSSSSSVSSVSSSDASEGSSETSSGQSSYSSQTSSDSSEGSSYSSHHSSQSSIQSSHSSVESSQSSSSHSSSSYSSHASSFSSGDSSVSSEFSSYSSVESSQSSLESSHSSSLESSSSSSSDQSSDSSAWSSSSSSESSSSSSSAKSSSCSSRESSMESSESSLGSSSSDTGGWSTSYSSFDSSSSTFEADCGVAGTCTYSDDFTADNFGRNWPTQVDTHTTAANDWRRHAGYNFAAWDGSKSVWHGKIAYYKDTCHSDDHDVTVTVEVGIQAWRSGAVGRGNGSDTCYAGNRTSSDTTELKKIVAGTRTTLSDTAQYDSKFTLRVNGTTIAVYRDGDSSPILEETDSDIEHGLHMGIIGIGGTSSTEAYVKAWETVDV